MLCLLKNKCVAMGVSYPVHVVYSIYDYSGASLQGTSWGVCPIIMRLSSS